MERGQRYTVQVGYLKGAASAGTNLVFNVISIPGTASEFTFYHEQNLTKFPLITGEGDLSQVVEVRTHLVIRP